MKKKLLFVINTLSRAGAETALLALLNSLNPEQVEVSLFVLMGQGELVPELPGYVRVLNKSIQSESVLTAAGRKYMARTMGKAMLSRGTILRKFPYMVSQTAAMVKRGRFSVEKLLWPVLAEGAPRLEEEFDLAVAYLEGGSAYYVANFVKAKKKAAFIHIDYAQAGYNRKIDGDCYLKFDRIFTVSKEIQEPFLNIYPELAQRMDVFHNILDVQRIYRLSKEPGGFPQDFDGWKLLTVGRLKAQKALEISIDAMKLLKDSGIKARWYVLGEGDQRAFLENHIRQQGLEQDFILMGAVGNPYPWFAQADLYVHCSRFEGKSIAIQEALLLGCPVVVSDCSGNREQLTDGVNGQLCQLSASEIARTIRQLLADPERMERYRRAASEQGVHQCNELNKLYELLS